MSYKLSLWTDRIGEDSEKMLTPLASDDVKAPTRAYNIRLKNKLYSLLCLYEEKKEWMPLLDKIIIELMGFPEEYKDIYYYILMTNLSALKILNYENFRKTIFTCMSILDKKGE